MGLRRQLERRRARGERKTGWSINLIGSGGNLPRMSDSLVALAKPLLDEVGYDEESWQEVIDLAAVVWNATVDGKSRGEVLATVGEIIDDPAKSELVVDALLERKVRLFAADKRFVVAAEVYRRGRDLHVTAASVR